MAKSRGSVRKGSSKGCVCGLKKIKAHTRDICRVVTGKRKGKYCKAGR